MQGGRHTSPIIALAMLGMILAIAAASSADDPPRAPQPISPAEVARYGDILRLSDEQQFAVEGLFENYLDEFEPLRIEMMEVAIRHPQHRMMDEDEFTARLPSFVTRTRSVDELFFTGIEPLLTDAQSGELPRVRLLRERSLYANLEAVTRFIGDGIPDLSILVDDLDLPPEIIDPLRPSLLSYEDRLTRGLRGIFEAIVRLCGGGDDRAADLLIERVRSLRAMNRRAFGEFRAAIPEDAGYRLHDEFFLRVYGGVQQAARPYVLNQYERALAIVGLSDQQREAVWRMQREARGQYEAALETMANFVDEDAIKHAGPGGARGSQAYLDLVNSARQDMMGKGREMRDALLAVIGDEHADALRSAPRPQSHASGTWRMSCGVVVHTNRVYEIPRSEPRPFWRGDSLMAAPMTRAEFEDVLLHLDPPDDERELLRDLYRGYAETLEEQLGPLHREHMMLSTGRMNDTPEDRRERRSQLPGLRAKVLAVVEQADDLLFHNILVTLDLDEDDPRWQRLRALRKRVVRHIPTMSGDRYDQDKAAEVDIVSVLIHARLTEDEWEEIADSLPEYEAGMLKLLEVRLEAIPAEGRPLVIYGPEDWEEMRRRGEAPHVAHREVTRLSSAAANRIAAQLPWATAWRVQSEFNRRAYPLAYGDPANMERAIAAAASLPDLGAAQRDQITEIRAEFTAAYEQARTRIVELCAAYEPLLMIPHLSFSISPERAEMDEHFTQTIAKLSDERAAINRRALRGLRTALTPAQLRRLDLPQVE